MDQDPREGYNPDRDPLKEPRVDIPEQIGNGEPLTHPSDEDDLPTTGEIDPNPRPSLTPEEEAARRQAVINSINPSPNLGGVQTEDYTEDEDEAPTASDSGEPARKYEEGEREPWRNDPIIYPGD
jgi:hypothetical protein